MVSLKLRGTARNAAKLICAAAIATAAYYIAREWQVHAQSVEAVTVQPFRMEQWVISYVTVPEGEVITKDVFQRRADGAISKRTLLDTPPTRDGIRLLTLPDGRHMRLFDAERVRTSIWWSELELARFKKRMTMAESHAREENTSCGGSWEFSGGKEFVAGHETQVWWRESMNDVNKLTRMTWYRAPDLGCTPLQQVFEQRQADGSYKVKWRRQAQSVLLDGLDSADFDPGDSYAEVRPSEFERRTKPILARAHEAHLAGSCSPGDCQTIAEIEQYLTGLDAKYDARKRQ